MLDIKPEHDWQSDEEGERITTGKRRFGQALDVDLVRRKQQLWRFGKADAELYVRKTIVCDSEQKRKNAQREYEILKKLDHPNILVYVDFEYRRRYRAAILYTRLCREGDLSVFLATEKDPKFPERFAWQVLRQISSALVYIHHGITVLLDGLGRYEQIQLAARMRDLSRSERRLAESYLHRDIKPSNIYLSEVRYNKDLPIWINVRLGDFGLAKVHDATTLQSYVCTREYPAPEARNAANPRMFVPRSDIWALGKTLSNLTMHISVMETTLSETIRDCQSDAILDRPSAIELLQRVSSDWRPVLHAVVEGSRAWDEEEEYELVRSSESLIPITESTDRRDVILHLLDCGVDVHQKGKGGETALHWAIGRNPALHDLPVRLCLEKNGANAFLRDAYGLTAMDWFCLPRSLDSKSVVKLQWALHDIEDRRSYRAQVKSPHYFEEAGSKRPPAHEAYFAAYCGNGVLLEHKLVREFRRSRVPVDNGVVLFLAAYHGHAACLAMLHRILKPSEVSWTVSYTQCREAGLKWTGYRDVFYRPRNTVTIAYAAFVGGHADCVKAVLAAQEDPTDLSALLDHSEVGESAFERCLKLRRMTGELVSLWPDAEEAM